jgi:hemerythrin
MDTLYIVWNDRYNVGVPIIDEQHRGIVTAINTLFEFIKQGQGQEALKPTFLVLEQYTQLHFKTEQRLLEEIKYPDLEGHIGLHRKLIDNTGQIKRASLANNDPDMVMVFLKEWWLGHINKEDRKYSSHIANRH